jgi:hypothetical protein
MHVVAKRFQGGEAHSAWGTTLHVVVQCLMGCWLRCPGRSATYWGTVAARHWGDAGSVCARPGACVPLQGPVAMVPCMRCYLLQADAKKDDRRAKERYNV